MSSTTKLSFNDFLLLPEREGPPDELDEGYLVKEASPTFLHNLIRDRLARELSEFVKKKPEGRRDSRDGFRLVTDTVRNPDIAFLTAEDLAMIDVDRSPVEDAPALAVEVISPSNLAQDTLKKAGQYLAAGTKAVWIIYPALRVVEIHKPEGIRLLKEPGALTESELFGPEIFSLSLETLFSSDPFL